MPPGITGNCIEKMNRQSPLTSKFQLNVLLNEFINSQLKCCEFFYLIPDSRNIYLLQRNKFQPQIEEFSSSYFQFYRRGFLLVPLRN
jgi:hypothetical protein